MSDIDYRKARVLLINEKTGETIGEVEIISDSQEIFYNNNKPLPKAIGKYPAGKTFNKEPIADILESILYEVEYSKPGNITLSNGEAVNSSEDITITKPLGSQIDEFTITSEVFFGSYDNLTAILCIYKGGRDYLDSIELIRPTPNTASSYVTFTVPAFSEDTDICIETISNGVRNKSSIIRYRFVSPIWLGWVTDDIFDSSKIGKIVRKDKAEQYLQELIDHNSINIEKRYTDKSNQNIYIVPDRNYLTRETLHPFILIPQSWGELKRIVDMNGNNIIDSYALCKEVDINTFGNYIEHYFVYVSRGTFFNDSNLVKQIKYITDYDIDYHVNMGDIYGNCVPLITNYSVQQNIPLDERFYRKTYEDLLKMPFPYIGLCTYVEDINTTFRFEHNNWTPVNTKIHVVESTDELTEKLGGWDDLAINAMDNKIWKKRYNNQWERYGDFKFEDGNISFNINKSIKNEEDNNNG